MMDSYTHLQHWFSEIKNQSEPDALIFLVGNKKDREEDLEVSAAKGEAFAKEKQLNGFFETSAKTGEGVHDTFVDAAKMLFKLHYRKIRQLKMQSASKGKRLKRDTQTPTRSKGCSC